MSKSNYQIMQGQMAERFLQYSQEQMTEKFHLPCDESYIYVTFVSSLYRINRQTGEIQIQEPGTKDWGKTDYNEAMSIYDCALRFQTGLPSFREICQPEQSERNGIFFRNCGQYLSEIYRIF